MDADIPIPADLRFTAPRILLIYIAFNLSSTHTFVVMKCNQSVKGVKGVKGFPYNRYKLPSHRD